jgi:hypothetical protein
MAARSPLDATGEVEAVAIVVDVGEVDDDVGSDVGLDLVVDANVAVPCSDADFFGRCINHIIGACSAGRTSRHTTKPCFW